MDAKVVLDEKSFKALSADSRISILKNLTDRRRTLTELSQKLGLGGSTIKEHCDILVNAELIKQVDEGRKWKYYELTQKGKQIVAPSLFDEVKVLIMLCIGTIIVGGFVFFLLQSLTLGSPMASGAYDDSTNLIKATGSTAAQETKTLTDANPTTYCQPAPPTRMTQGISIEIFEASILIALIAGIIIGWHFTRKRG